MSIYSRPIAGALERSWVDCGNQKIVIPPGAPKSSILASSLNPTRDPVYSSSHTVGKMELSEGKENQFFVYHKKCDSTYPPILAQMEAASSASYRLVRGEASAKVRPVIDYDGNVSGAASYEIPGFRPMFDVDFKVDNLIKYNVASELVARYMRQEDDEHGNNFGVCFALGTIVGLDFDMSWNRRTSKIKGHRVGTGVYLTNPEDAFPQTARDLKNFPVLTDQKPCHWPTQSPRNGNWKKEFPNKQEFIELAKHGEFKRQVYFAFLVEVLVTEELHLSEISKHFTSKPEDQLEMQWIQNEWKERIARQEYLLIQYDQFRDFIAERSYLLARLDDHFKFTLKECDEDKKLEFFQSLETRFLMIVKKCMVKDLTIALYKLGLRLKCKPLQKAYPLLVDIVEAFQDDRNIFYHSILELEKTFLSCVDANTADLFSKVIDRYRHFSLYQGSTVSQSIYLQASREGSPPLDRQIEPVRVVSKALYEWFCQSEHHQICMESLEKCIASYPASLGSLNPLSHFRKREESLQSLKNNWILHAKEGRKAWDDLIEFIKSGGWNLPNPLRKASANVILLDNLIRGFLEQFKTELSPKLLKNHDLVQICYLCDNKEWNLIENIPLIGNAMIHTPLTSEGDASLRSASQQ